MGARPGEDLGDSGGVRVRELGNFGQHDGDDFDVQNADPSVVQVVRKGLTVDRGRVVVRAIPDESKVWSLTPFFFAHFS